MTARPMASITSGNAESGSKRDPPTPAQLTAHFRGKFEDLASAGCDATGVLFFGDSDIEYWDVTAAFPGQRLQHCGETVMRTRRGGADGTAIRHAHIRHPHISAAHTSVMRAHATRTAHHFGKTVMRILLKTAPPGADAGPSRRVARVWFCIAKPFEAHW